ncbi:MAG: hypothetical protein QG657_1652 [Acidobacteriota bacterium]|nr:hypothetical protein [Acidobacteriota bacterium]
MTFRLNEKKLSEPQINLITLMTLMKGFLIS